ncbi:MAG: sodium:proton antiporter [Alphaproteobacteria bacterium]|nr:sodium:proton antiporter [Alphaproteobacteria bacterium]MBU0804088.1 sodium:proton antiporter [Alphaproteobacteria bacterium]MBU0872615.1 sodium:proton antiporter [Alphaproteobacteria bacterium]MBU1403627.1 sodium:proton antiporter [Alphaproteobacteria bacterium]MBU1593654.1 sodium:proton antiporter [Alphaproteobacteria bacterium]
MSAFDLIALLLVLTATFGWINHRFIKLPNTIGMLVMGLASSLLLIAFELSVPEISLYEDLTQLVGEFDFQNTVLNGMLAFLLFAGALHVDLGLLRMRAAVVGTMATFGVLISTAVVGLGFWGFAQLVGVDISLPWAMVFGALISPTDPVAVLSTLKAVRVPKSLEVDMIGESLFNDGVGVVIFAVILSLAVGLQGGAVDLAHVAELFVVEALGGALLGLIAGYIAYRAMLAIDDYPIEVLISLALVTGAYALAAKLHLSGPIAVVVGGLLIGNRGAALAMSDETQRYLFGFWTLIDEMLNSVLFLLIGLEVLVLRYDPSFVWLALVSIPLVLLGRLLAVSMPVLALSARQDFVRGTIPVLVWGGLRGGISVALALSIPEVAEKSVLLAATYTVVVFTIVVQGLSLRRLVQRVVE